MQSRRRKLILFDVDGTLVLYKDRISNRIFERLAQTFFARDISLDGYRFSGKTDKAIVHEVLSLNGIADEEILKHEQEIFTWIPREFESCTSAATLWNPEVSAPPPTSIMGRLGSANADNADRRRTSVFDMTGHSVQHALYNNLTGSVNERVPDLERNFGALRSVRADLVHPVPGLADRGAAPGAAAPAVVAAVWKKLPNAPEISWPPASEP